MRKCFAGLWSLEDSDAVNEAIERPHLFVMKPQREGGGLIFSYLRFAIIAVIEVLIINTREFQGTIFMEMM